MTAPLGPLLAALLAILVVGPVAAGCASALRVGSVFEGARAAVEARAAAGRGAWPRLAELLGCRLCLSLQLALWISLGLAAGLALAAGDGRWLALALTFPASGYLAYRAGD